MISQKIISSLFYFFSQSILKTQLNNENSGLFDVLRYYKYKLKIKFTFIFYCFNRAIFWVVYPTHFWFDWHMGRGHIWRERLIGRCAYPICWLVDLHSGWSLLVININISQSDKDKKEEWVRSIVRVPF